MGKRNYLIEGVSGSGKTTVATALEKLGYQTIHGDQELKYRGDPETGESLQFPGGVSRVLWESDHQIWDLEKVEAYIKNKDYEVTFFCGGSRNHFKFIPRLDGVFVLDVDKEVMMKRIFDRVAVDPTDFGATEEERELILELHKTKQDIPKVGTVIDANRPLEIVVSSILSHIEKRD